MKFVCSAPGKVLATGGYLILKQPFRGIVIGTSARFTSTIEIGLKNESNDSILFVQVESPQFNSISEYSIEYDKEKDQILINQTSKNQPSNPYVESALAFSLLYHIGQHPQQSWTALVLSLKSSLKLTICGDNDFYSQDDQLKSRNLPYTCESLKSLPKHAPCLSKGGLSTLKKTGLGSSAALVTSAVGCLFTVFNSVERENQTEIIENLNNNLEKLTIIHNIAQVAHCAAQGKIGSGFDVSAAIFGTHVYSRFSPSLLDKALNETNASTKVYPNSKIVIECVNSKWNSIQTPLKTPSNMKWILGDVGQGSGTPALVSSVLTWWNQTADSAVDSKGDSCISPLELTTALNNANEKVLNTLISMSSAKESEMETLIAEAKQQFFIVRQHLKKLGDCAGVPVEPKSQTDLLDFTSKNQSVVFCGVPGAGGFDAVFVLVRNDKSIEEIEKQWQQWSSDTNGHVTLLPTTHDNKGIQFSLENE